MNAIDKAVELAGGRTKLAELIGVTPQFIWQMQRGIRPIPAALCRRIEAATGVKREDLRPDVFGQVEA